MESWGDEKSMLETVPDQSQADPRMSLQESGYVDCMLAKAGQPRRD
jgi:hypothetical protein